MENNDEGLSSPEVSNPIKDVFPVQDATTSEEATVNLESSEPEAQTETPLPDTQIPCHSPNSDENINSTLSSTSLKPAPSVQTKNGYTFPFHLSKKTPYPKHSISCHENMSSLADATDNSSSRFSAGRSLKNGYVKGKYKSARSAGSQIRPSIAKSASINLALCEATERRSSTSNNSGLSFSYFTSSFNIFTDKLNP